MHIYNPFQGLTNLFEEDNMVFFKLKEGNWVDCGRGKLRIWKKDETGIKWMSFVSVGTKKELLTLIQYGTTQIDNRIILTQKDITSFDPQVYENGVLVTSGETHFLFKSLGAKHAEPEADFKEDETEDGQNSNSTEAPKEEYWLQVANRLLNSLQEHSNSLPSPIRDTANGVEDEL